MSMLLATILAAGLIGPLDQTVVSPEWLQNNLDDPNVIVVEIGAAAMGLNHPHIPGARFVPIESLVARDRWPGDELPAVDRLRRAFDRAGVGNEGRIILYSESPLEAARAWFTLDYLGHAGRTSILDGGFRRWAAERRPVSTTRRPMLAKTFVPATDPTRVISRDEVRQAIASGAVLIDARSVYEYYGVKGRRVPRRGHIPGALYDVWKTNLKQDGSFRPAAELEAAYAKLAGNPDARVIVYCHSGMEASLPYFVLRSLGYDVALYDGSYAEWSADGALPVTTAGSSR